MKTLLCTSLSPEKLYALPYLWDTLRTIQGADRVLITIDRLTPEQILPEQPLPEHYQIIEETIAPDLSIPHRIGIIREAQRQAFLQSDAAYLYFHDADQIPPNDIIPKLQSHSVDAITGLYNQRRADEVLLPMTAPYIPCETMQAPIPITDFGFGSVLFSRHTAETVAFVTDGNFEPDAQSEDATYCRHMALHNITLYIDPALTSWHIREDNTVNRLTAIEPATACIWVDYPATITNKHGLWLRNRPRFNLTEPLQTSGFLSISALRCTLEIQTLPLK